MRIKIKRIVPEIAQFIFFFGGLSAIAYGAWMLYRPLGPIIGGILAVWVAFQLAKD